ncbi:UNVERIFIED_ORG: hypothetical protein OKW25_002622 [Pseudomonas vranovensis]|nr:hypothetical protein [Pseudomonas vranovensis]
MSDNPNAHAVSASLMAADTALCALIAALKAGGSLDTKVFKDKLAELERIQEGCDKLNQTQYTRSLALYVAAAEGRLPAAQS